MKQHREIKFRAWDGKMMRPSKQIGIWQSKCLFLDDGLVKKWILMQYTGLKDRNGVEIYEGDIVKWGHIKGGEEDPIRVAEVRMGPQVEFVSRQKRVCRTGEDEYRFGYGTFAYRDTQNWICVIGNIHENPELLTP